LCFDTRNHLRLEKTPRRVPWPAVGHMKNSFFGLHSRKENVSSQPGDLKFLLSPTKDLPGEKRIKTHSTPEFSRPITLFLVTLCRSGAKFFLFPAFFANIRRTFFRSAPKMQLALRLEFLEIGTGRYSSAPTFFQNLTRTKYAGLNFGCRGRSGLPSWRRRHSVVPASLCPPGVPQATWPKSGV